MIEKDKLEIYDKAICSYGINAQKWMLVEECGELLNALAKNIHGRGSFEELNTELADVSIMVEQIAYFYGYDKFLKEKEFKLNRLKERIDKHESKT